MKSLHDHERANEIRRRIDSLRTDTPRQWGKMTAPQVLEHCAIALGWAVDDTHPPRMLLGRLLAPFIRPKVVGNDEPLQKNTPTARQLVISNQPDLEAARARLHALLDRFESNGREKCTRHPHTFFGKLTPDEWGVLMYKHLDHHLRQFNA